MVGAAGKIVALTEQLISRPASNPFTRDSPTYRYHFSVMVSTSPTRSQMTTDVPLATGPASLAACPPARSPVLLLSVRVNTSRPSVAPFSASQLQAMAQVDLLPFGTRFSINTGSDIFAEVLGSPQLCSVRTLDSRCLLPHARLILCRLCN